MINLLILLTIVLALITGWRLMRVLELVRDLRDDEEDDHITTGDNKFNGLMSLIFLVVCFVGMIYFTIDAKKYLLPVAASKHGVLTDAYLYQNFALIIVVFFITQTLLFYYAWKYQHKKGEKALFRPDNHKLEFWWTVIPAIVLMGLIVYGLQLWISITNPAPKDAMVIEVYGKQFDWTVRYAGEKNILGRSNYKLITDGVNDLGVDSLDPESQDDKIVRGELHLPVGKNIVFKFHSRDIIHSAYFPHLRAQMNCVPGMTTEFTLEPTITTDSMRKILNHPGFDYILLCNKICGVSHFNMRLKVIVEPEAEFQKWYATQQYVFARPEEVTPAVTVEDSVKNSIVLGDIKK